MYYKLVLYQTFSNCYVTVVTVDTSHWPVDFFPFACWDCGLLSSWRKTVSKFCFTTNEMDKISRKLVIWNFEPLDMWNMILL